PFGNGGYGIVIKSQMAIGPRLGACKYVPIDDPEIFGIHPAGIDKSRYFRSYPRNVILAHLHRCACQGNYPLRIKFTGKQQLPDHRQVLWGDRPYHLSFIDGIDLIALGTYQSRRMWSGNLVDLDSVHP